MGTIVFAFLSNLNKMRKCGAQTQNRESEELFSLLIMFILMQQYEPGEADMCRI